MGWIDTLRVSRATPDNKNKPLIRGQGLGRIDSLHVSWGAIGSLGAGLSCQAGFVYKKFGPSPGPWPLNVSEANSAFAQSRIQRAED